MIANPKCLTLFIDLSLDPDDDPEIVWELLGTNIGQTRKSSRKRQQRLENARKFLQSHRPGRELIDVRKNQFLVTDARIDTHLPGQQSAESPPLPPPLPQELPAPPPPNSELVTQISHCKPSKHAASASCPPGSLFNGASRSQERVANVSANQAMRKHRAKRKNKDTTSGSMLSNAALSIDENRAGGAPTHANRLQQCRAWDQLATTGSQVAIIVIHVLLKV